MDAGLTYRLRTELRPEDRLRGGRAVRTQLRPADLDPRAVPVNASLQGDAPAPSQHDLLVGHAQRWVAQAFFGTLLRQARSSPFATGPFAGGRGGQAFGTMLDQELADRMSRGAGRRLAESIVRSIEGRNAAKPVAGSGGSSE